MVEEDNYAAAIQWMDSIGVDITTSSLGYTVFDDAAYRYEDLTGNTAICTKAINYAFSKGILTFTASGNSANDPWFYVSTPGDGYEALQLALLQEIVKLQTFLRAVLQQMEELNLTFPPPEFPFMVPSLHQKTSLKDQRTSAATPIAAGIGGQLLSLFPHLKKHTGKIYPALYFRSKNDA